MNAETIQTLAAHIADVADTDGGNIVSITMGEMADGSRRHFALIETQDNGLDQTYRVSSPAPWDSPAWASVYTDWTYEVRVGDGWLELETA